jgi:hypothetical protein
VPRHVARLVVPLVVDYFTYAARLGASARRGARPRLLRLRCASGCLGTSRGSSCGSSSITSPALRVRVPCSLRSSLSTTSPMLCDRVPRPLARLVVDLAPSLPLDFSSVGRTGSCRASVTPSRGSGTRRPVALAQLPMSCIWTRHLRRSTSRRSVALALVVRPVTPSHGLATRRSGAPALVHLCRASGRAVFAARQLDTGCINSLPKQHS